MRNIKIYPVIAVLLTLVTSSCGHKNVEPEQWLDSMPPIFPDYTEVTVAPNLVAPRFWLADTVGAEAVQAVFETKSMRVVVDGDDREINLSKRDWDALRHSTPEITVTLMVKKDGHWKAYAPFNIYVAPEKIDSFIAYRLIEPGYESWNEMGIYQRCLENYRASAIITNRQTDYGCLNCHSFCQQSADTMLLHMRVEHPGTYIVQDGEITKLNTKTADNVSALVYPSWHPSGRYVAFSVNDTKQLFHTTDPNRIEVFDNESDVVVYDVEGHEIISTPLLKRTESFETFPTFSPDGRRLYYCTADSVTMPEGYDRLKYSICSVAFDPATRTFGTEADTLYNATATGRSASFPRVSPDGRWLMFTVSEYGTFSIWHRDADLYMADLTTGEIRPLDALNSDETESYHSWSHNGRWVVFSSRRLDGLYTRPYIAYIDENGEARKPLVLPQSDEQYYSRMMKSYNVPEFITDYVKVSGYDISQVAKNDPGIDVTSQPLSGEKP